MRARLPWILFAISLTLNLAIAGAIAWHMWRGDDHSVDRAPVMRAANSLKLDAQQREKLAQFRKAARQSLDTMRQTIRPLRRELLGQLAKPQPDFDAIDQKIDAIGGEEAKMQKAMVRAFADFYASLTAEQRTEFRKHLRDRVGRRFFSAIVHPDGDQRPPRGRDGNRPSRDGTPPPADRPGAPPAPAPAR